MSDARKLTALKPFYKAGDWELLLSAAMELLEKNQEDQTLGYVAAGAAYSMSDLVQARDIVAPILKQAALSSEICDFAAILFAEFGDLQQATFYAKMAAAYPSNPALKPFLPPKLPTLGQAFEAIQEEPFLRKALAALALEDSALALHWLDQAVRAGQASTDAYLLQCRILLQRGQLQDAVQTLLGARHRYPDDARIALACASQLSLAGDERLAAAVFADAKRLDPGRPAVALEEILHLLRSSSEDDGRVGRALAAVARDGAPSFPKAERRPGSETQPLTIGYLFGDSDAVPEAARAALLAAHDRNRFRIVVFARGDAAAPENATARRHVAAWHNIERIDAWTLGAMVQGEGVDILVNLCGYGNDTAFLTTVARPAPLCLTWGGALAGAGRDGVLQISDAFFDRPEDAFPIGPLALLPRSSLLLEPKPASDALSSLEGNESLPSERVLLGADVSLHEMTPETVALFARVLRALPQAALQFVDHDFLHPANVERVVALFGAFGLSHRVEVSDASSLKDFFRSSTLVLVPPQTQRAASVLTALRCGRPAVCLDAPVRWRRVGGAVVDAAGYAATMLARSEEQYAALARQWVEDPAALKRFALNAPSEVENSSLSDVAGLVRSLEDMFERLWRNSGG